MRRTVIILALILFLVGCQSAPVPTVVVPPTSTSTPQPTATLTPSPTPTFTPSPTFTLTPTPTNTPTPTATPLPDGYYEHDGAGFSFVLPTGWHNAGEDASTVLFIHELDGFVLLAGLYIDDTEGTFDETVEMLLDPSGEFFVSSGEIVDRSELEIKDGVVADHAYLRGTGSDGTDIGIRCLEAGKQNRKLTILVIGMDSLIQTRGHRITHIFESISLGGSRVFGLDRGQTLVFLGSDPLPKQLDPARTTGAADGYTGHLYSGLVRLNSQLQLESDLAETWTISPDGLVYTFTLRSGLTFADGSPLTADDVKFSWERAADPETDSTTARTYLGDIEGVEAKLDGEADEISGLMVVDDLTLVVTLKEARPSFLAKLTYPTSFVVDKESVSGNPEKWPYKPNESGPYLLKEIREGEAVIFEKNEAYYQPANIPYLVYLLYRAGTSTSLFEAEEVDVIYLDVTEARDIQAEDHALHEHMLSNTNMCVSYLMFNNTTGPMQDANVRKALAMAVDKDQLIEILTEGMGLRADTLLPPGMPGFSADLATNPYNPEEARAALADSDFASNMPALVINMYGYGGEDNDFINAITSMWSDTLGIRVEVEYLDPQDYTRLAREQHGDIVFQGWCADYPDPQNFLDILFHSESEFNVSGYINEEVDSYLEQARSELDPAVRLQLYNQAESLLLLDYASLPMLTSVSYVLVNPRVEGYQLDPIGVPIVHRLSLNQSTGEE